MGVLQKHPLAFRCGTSHVLARNDLLSLTHTDTQGLDLLLLGKVL